jgi:hypothetical protein
MAVYVDQLLDWGFVIRGVKHKSCHMIADTNEELHAMAEAIGMKRQWFQQVVSGPHYDLIKSRRDAAVALGAIEVNIRVVAAKMKAWRLAAVARIGAARDEAERAAIRAHMFR